LAAYKAGKSFEALGLAFNLTPSRCYQIVRHYLPELVERRRKRRARRSEKRKAIKAAKARVREVVQKVDVMVAEVQEPGVVMLALKPPPESAPESIPEGPEQASVDPEARHNTSIEPEIALDGDPNDPNLWPSEQAWLAKVCPRGPTPAIRQQLAEAFELLRRAGVPRGTEPYYTYLATRAGLPRVKWGRSFDDV
jgi:hypothetical protein